MDFGSYETSVRDGDVKNTICFSFRVDEVNPSNYPVYYDFEDAQVFYSSRHYKNQTVLRGVSYNVSIMPFGTRTRIKTIDLKIEEPIARYVAHFNEDGVLTSLNINGVNSLDLFGETILRISPGSLFPEVFVERKQSTENKSDFIFRRSHRDLLVEPMAGFLREHLHKRTSDEVIWRLAATLLNFGPHSRQSILDNLSKAGPSTWKHFLEDVMTTDKRKLRQEIYRLIWACIFTGVATQCAAKIRSVFSEILYIGPVRARSERYYRYQDLAVSEIDPDGKNFPMFLNSLTRPQMQRLSQWVENLFGYGVEINRDSGGHISIDLKDRGVATNVVDVGYGVSQVLPVLAQIWWARSRPRRAPREDDKVTILAIEQPELHLHPAHQALLADAMVGQTQASGSQANLRFIVETHSETMINRIGELIYEKKLNADDVQIVLFQPDDDQRSTTAHVANFDSSGALENWPYGFFQPVIGD